MLTFLSCSVFCTVQWDTTACNGFTQPTGKPAGRITRRFDRGNTSRSTCLAVFGAYGEAGTTHAVTLQVLPGEIGHTGRQGDNEQPDGARSLVGSTIG